MMTKYEKIALVLSSIAVLVSVGHGTISLYLAHFLETEDLRVSIIEFQGKYDDRKWAYDAGLLISNYGTVDFLISRIQLQVRIPTDQGDEIGERANWNVTPLTVPAGKSIEISMSDEQVWRNTKYFDQSDKGRLKVFDRKLDDLSFGLVFETSSTSSGTRWPAVRIPAYVTLPQRTFWMRPLPPVKLQEAGQVPAPPGPLSLEIVSDDGTTNFVSETKLNE